MAAVLAVGGAVLSHLDAAIAWGLVEAEMRRVIELSVSGRSSRRPRPGLLIHRRRPGMLRPARALRRIPLTDPGDAVIDIAPRLSPAGLEHAINQADKLDLATPEQLHERAAANPRRPGAVAVRDLIGQAAFVLSDSELESRFNRIAARAGLPRPHTGVMLNGYEVDFHWPELALVVETDGGRFHRTPLQQTRDRRRDQAHFAARMIPLRFTHGQVRFHPDEVVAVLRRVAADQSSNRNAAPGRSA